MFWDHPYSKFYPSWGATIITCHNQSLAIICEKCCYGLWSYITKTLQIRDWPDGEKMMDEMIQNNPRDTFYKAIFAIDRNNFVLNISPCYESCPIPEASEMEKRFIEEQTIRFVPLIKLFLEEAVTEPDSCL